MWSKLMMLKLHIEEAKISVSDTVVSNWTPSSTPEGRRTEHIRQITHEHQNQRREEEKISVFLVTAGSIINANARCSRMGHRGRHSTYKNSTWTLVFATSTTVGTAGTSVESNSGCNVHWWFAAEPKRDDSWDARSDITDTGDDRDHE